MSLIWFAAISMVGITTTRLLLRDAVVGYEDGAGFHYGAAETAAALPAQAAGA